MSLDPILGPETVPLPSVPEGGCLRIIYQASGSLAGLWAVTTYDGANFSSPQNLMPVGVGLVNGPAATTGSSVVGVFQDWGGPGFIYGFIAQDGTFGPLQRCGNVQMSSTPAVLGYGYDWAMVYSGIDPQIAWIILPQFGDERLNGENFPIVNEPTTVYQLVNGSPSQQLIFLQPDFEHIQVFISPGGDQFQFGTPFQIDPPLYGPSAVVLPDAPGGANAYVFIVAQNRSVLIYEWSFADIYNLVSTTEFLVGSRPAVVSWNSKVWMCYQGWNADIGSNGYLHCRSFDGSTWSSDLALPNVTMSGSPCAAVQIPDPPAAVIKPDQPEAR